MPAAVSNTSRTYWRPTRFTSIVYAHVREGLEDIDDPIHQVLAQWATYQRNYVVSLALLILLSLRH